MHSVETPLRFPSAMRYSICETSAYCEKLLTNGKVLHLFELPYLPGHFEAIAYNSGQVLFYH